MISPSSPTRQVLDQAISRRSPASVSQRVSDATGNCSGRIPASAAQCLLDLLGRHEHVPRPPAEHVRRRVAGDRSQAWLKRTIRPSPSSTRTSAPAVSMPAEVRSRSAFSAACARIGSVMSVATPRKPVTAPSVVVLDGDRQRDAEPLAVLAHVRPLRRLGALAARDGDEDLGARLDAQLRRALRDLVRVVDQRGRRHADDLVRAVAEHPLGAGVEQRDRRRGRVARDDRRLRRGRPGRPRGGRAPRAPRRAAAGSSARSAPRPSASSSAERSALGG